MNAMTKQATRQPVEDLMLNAAQMLTDQAYERFTQGDLSKDQLQEFYGILRNWSKVSEQVLDTMNKLCIRTY